MKWLTTFIGFVFGFFLVLGILFLLFRNTADKNPAPVQVDAPVVQTVIEPEDTVEAPEPETDEELEKKLEAERRLIEKEAWDRSREALRAAVSSKTIELCEQVENKEMKAECRDSLHLSSAMKEMNPQLCLEITDQAKKTYCSDQLIFAQAEYFTEFSRCAEIVSQSIRERCLDAAAKNKLLHVKSIADCSDIDAKEEKALCMNYYLSLNSNSEEGVDPCESLLEASDKDQCRLRVAIENAEQKKSPQICMGLQSEQNQQLCLKQVQQILTQQQAVGYMQQGNVENCDAIAEPGMKTFCRDRSLIMKARLEHNPALCREISNPQQKDLCLEMSTSESKVYYYNLARSEKDSKWCAFIPDAEARGSCELVVSKM